MPRVFGDNLIHVSEVDAIVENHVQLVELKDKPLSQEDRIIGTKIAEMVPDGACLQFGIGGIPNAVAKYLTNHKELGVHRDADQLHRGSYEAGAITNKKKSIHRYKTVFTLCSGSRKLYDFIDDNPAVESYPSWHTNDPAVIEQNDNVVSVNSIIEIDLLGQVNAESIDGNEFSGVGGQRDFMSGAFRSKGGCRSLPSILRRERGRYRNRSISVRGRFRFAHGTDVRGHRIRHDQLESKTTSQRSLSLMSSQRPSSGRRL